MASQRRSEGGWRWSRGATDRISGPSSADRSDPPKKGCEVEKPPRREPMSYASKIERGLLARTSRRGPKPSEGAYDPMRCRRLLLPQGSVEALWRRVPAVPGSKSARGRPGDSCRG